MTDNQASTQGRHPGPGKVPWRCDTCGRSAYPGWVWISRPDIVRHDRALAAWKSRHPDGKPLMTADLLSYPEPARWQVVCRDCDERRRMDGVEDDEFYSFATGRAATLADMLDWCAHLSEKNWLASTDWATVLRELSKAAAAR